MEKDSSDQDCIPKDFYFYCLEDKIVLSNNFCVIIMQCNELFSNITGLLNVDLSSRLAAIDLT